MSQQLHALCAEWQARLRLQDWNITLEVEDFLDALGETRFDKYKNARITLCSPHTINPEQLAAVDLELTLVHELLHLSSSKITMYSPDEPVLDDALEEMIDIVAQSLVALKRTAIQNDATVKPKRGPQRKGGHGAKRAHATSKPTHRSAPAKRR